MASFSEDDAISCCVCSKIPVGKCFILDCDHILCDRCSHHDALYYDYGCTKHDRHVGIISLAYCHIESKTQKITHDGNFDISMEGSPSREYQIIKMSESVEFALKGQCNIERCNQKAIAVVKHCNHSLCVDCLKLVYEDGERRQSGLIACPVIQCQNQIPCVFTAGILGRCNIRGQLTRLTETVYFKEKNRCCIQIEDNRQCNKQGCFNCYRCGYDVCCGCMISYITRNHTPEYVNNCLTDVIYCLNKNCTKIKIIKDILQSLAKIEQDCKYYESMLSIDSKKCRTTFCKRTVTATIVKCGHNYCYECLKSTTLVDIPINGELIGCRKCRDVACRRWIHDANINSLTIGINDFLTESLSVCCIYKHGQAVVKTRCCWTNLCLKCLTDVMQKPGVVSSFFGKEYNDVIRCNDRCNSGVPKRFFLQFGKEHNYLDFVEKPVIEQTKDGSARNSESKNKNPIKKTKILQTGTAIKIITQSSNITTITTKYNDQTSTKKNSNGGKVTDGFDPSNTDMPQTLSQANTNNVEKIDTDKMQPSIEMNIENRNNKMTDILETEESTYGSRNAEKKRPIKCNTTETSMENVKKMDTAESQSTIEEEGSAGTDPLTNESAFEGIGSLMPVTNTTACIRCQSKAIGKLLCNHPYCYKCLIYIDCCTRKSCFVTVPRKEFELLLKNLNENARKESIANIVENISDKENTPQRRPETTDHASVVEMQGVRNLGMTCYANCIFQILGQTDKFRDRLTDSMIQAIEKNMKTPLTDNLTAILEQLTGKGSRKTVEIEVSNFLKKMESSFDRYLQNDCCEFLMSILERLKSENESLTLMFENTMQTFFRCKSCLQVEIIRPQISNSLLIPIAKGENSYHSVNAGLMGLLKIAKLGKDSCSCQNCNIKGDTIEQGLVLTKLPEILILQIGRVTTSTKHFFLRSAKKKDDLVKYDEHMEVPQTVEVNGKVHERIYKFSLYGVVLHSGSIDSGHYYSLVKKQHTDKWFCCNDSSVRPIEKKLVFENPNAYLLFYEKKHLIRNDHRSDICCQM